MWRARYAYNTTHQRFDDIAKLKRRILSGRIESAGCVTKEIIVVVWFRETWCDVCPVSEIKSTDGLSAARMSNDNYKFIVTFSILTDEEAKKKEKLESSFKLKIIVRQRDRLRYKELNKAELDVSCTFPEEWYGRWFQSGITDLVTVNGSEITSKGFCIEKNGDKFLVHDTHYYHRSSSYIEYRQGCHRPGKLGKVREIDIGHGELGKVRGKYKSLEFWNLIVEILVNKYLFENFKYTLQILNSYFKIKVSKFLNLRTILDSKTLWNTGTFKVDVELREKEKLKTFRKINCISLNCCL
ncbi:hypothetical protein G5I_05922 [Acromyrmex echinatior]|uniref:DUF7044 domain-containing protein n=1 Tax=Acromyrmex echinatior TaxID=103372 RepID=F4WJP1_ACREC|nr:hypothetical protein G5I_05922 [Acromyrmex echinatior]